MRAASRATARAAASAPASRGLGVASSCSDAVMGCGS